MVGKKFTVGQYCKKFSSSKKSFLWRRWSTAEGQLIFPFRFYGPKMCQCFKISHTFAPHFSLGLGRCKWGISIEMISCDKRFPSTQIWFSSAFAPPLFRGIARPTLDWLMTSLSHCISHQEIDPFWNSSAAGMKAFCLFCMRSRSWAGFHHPSLRLLFTTSQLLNDECLLASREFATKQKFRWEKWGRRRRKKHFKIKWMNDECFLASGNFLWSW